ncbi:MAG: hypothetical protein QHJ73_16755, partial [Armatimonadota bacterium]|nr:hypothetical protein [Armatimonadota bacterium]
WVLRIYPYIKNVDVFNCPSASFRWRGEPSTSMKYGINMTLFNVTPPVIMAKLDVPAQTCFCADSEGAASYGIFELYYAGPSTPRWVEPRHMDGALFTFCDGHAKWVKMERDSQNRPIHPTKKDGVCWLADGSR